MTTELRREDADERERVIGLRILTLCAAVELLVFSWLLAQRAAFFGFLWTPDTPGYLRLAQQLARNFTLVASHRTLGYPLLLAFSELIGGTNNGYYVVIVLQLVLNLGFTWGCWRLLGRLAPDTGVGLRAFATVLFFVAGLGMALLLMTDFLAAAFFAVFLYGMLFWRTRNAVLVSGCCLALATLTRPAFTLVPLFLPAFAYLIGRVTSRVPPLHVVVLAVFSVSATGISIIYQYTYNGGYLGPSPVLTMPIRETIYYGIEEGKHSDSGYRAFTDRFERQIEQRARRPYTTLSPSEKEDYAKAIFREEAAAHPGAVVAHVGRNFIKYMFVPVESMVMRLTFFYVGEHAFLTYVRPVLGVCFLPIWLLSLAPPIHGSQSHKAYHILLLLCVTCLVGFGAITFGSGERIRFPVMVFMLPVMVWNAQSLHSFLRARIGDWRRALFSRARFEN